MRALHYRRGREWGGRFIESSWGGDDDDMDESSVGTRGGGQTIVINLEVHCC